MGLISRVSSRTWGFKMAQGKLKAKATKPKALKKKGIHKNHNDKNRENKKGRMICAPKKKALQAGHRLQKELQKSINRISEAKSKGSSFHTIHKNQDLEVEKKK